jgi:hypothetical protein
LDTEVDRVLPRLRDVWLWIVTALDDVVVEKFWYRLRRGDVRGAGRAIWELVIGFPGCWVSVLMLVLLGLWLF